MGKSGKTIHPKMFNLGSPFSMEVTPLQNKKSRLQKKVIKLQLNILKSLTKWIWVKTITKKS